MTSSRPKSRRNVEKLHFDVGIYLTNVVTDLQDHLGYNLATSLREAVSSHVTFKTLVARALSEADCMDNVAHYAALRQIEACFSKLSGYGSASSDTRRAAALEKFLAAERKCKRVNRKLKHFSRYPGRMPAWIRRVVESARLELFRAFGSIPDDETLWSGAGFGPGLTFALKRDSRHLLAKISGDQTVTPMARGLALEVLSNQFPNWAQHLHKSSLQMTLGNRIAFVPKTAKIDRTIGIEPSLNVFLQKGVDEYLKDRAFALGVRIRSQDYSINCLKQQGAKVSTIDLSSASDCISIELVRMLIPSEWFCLLNTLRSHYYTLDKGESWTRYEKFSSMGNATTFPVESMIFAAITRACAREAGYSDQIRDSVRVYGDDIICPWECAGLVIESLRFLGFTTNSDKTFVFGPFRETCGVDLLHGVDVRPVYLRTVPSKPWEVAGLFNRLISNRFGFTFPLTLRWLHSLVEVPLYGPAYHGCSSMVEQSWSEWYAGKNVEGDAYFWAPHPHVRPVVVYHGDTPTEYVAMRRWGVLRYKPIRGFDESSRYLAFLLGVEGGDVQGDPVYGTRDSIFIGSWDPYAWNFPDIYAAPREPSERDYRQIVRAVLEY